MNEIHAVALFRYSVLGALVSRGRLERGELKATIRELAARDYDIPGSRNSRLSEKTIEAWYYAWRRGGIDALTPRPRVDRGQSKLPPEVQAAILAAKRENPRRSINQIRRLLEQRGTVATDALARSSVHRLLKEHGLSRPPGSASEPEEYRAYEAEYAGDIWYGDVMHGPQVPMGRALRKAYLVSLMDDASRLIPHSAFCPGGANSAPWTSRECSNRPSSNGDGRRVWSSTTGRPIAPRRCRGSVPVWVSIWSTAGLIVQRERRSSRGGIAPSVTSSSVSWIPVGSRI